MTTVLLESIYVHDALDLAAAASEQDYNSLRWCAHAGPTHELFLVGFAAQAL
jgi:hypothetical protein